MTLFDRPETVARQSTLLRHFEPLLLTIQRELSVKSVVDLGCAVGSYTRSLKRMGFDVTGVDVRSNNIEEARRRDGEAIRYLVANVEELGTDIGKFDMAFCVGLLYHLENPFRAIRNIARITNIVALIESQALPMGKPLLYMVNEAPADDQSVNAITVRPSEEALVKMLYRSGFSQVYRMASPPSRSFTGSWRTRRFRTVLVASRVPLDHVSLRHLKEPRGMPSKHPTWIGSVALAPLYLRRLRSAVRHRLFKQAT